MTPIINLPHNYITCMFISVTYINEAVITFMSAEKPNGEDIFLYVGTDYFRSKESCKYCVKKNSNLKTDAFCA